MHDRVADELEQKAHRNTFEDDRLRYIQNQAEDMRVQIGIDRSDPEAFSFAQHQFYPTPRKENNVSEMTSTKLFAENTLL